MWGVPWQPVVQPRLDVHHGQGHLGHAGGWISGNQGERQGAVRPTYVVKISWFLEDVSRGLPQSRKASVLACIYKELIEKPFDNGPFIGKVPASKWQS